MSKKAKTVQPEVVNFEIPMALAPIPGDVDKRELNENKITMAAKAAMNGGAPLKGPISITLSMSYPPGASMRRSHTWRVTAPTTWDLARFILPLLTGIAYVSAGQVARLTVEKTYGSRPLTVITVKPLV
jgi:Holliday junction resolvase RusA-like endonuclease